MSICTSMTSSGADQYHACVSFGLPQVSVGTATTSSDDLFPQIQSSTLSSVKTFDLRKKNAIKNIWLTFQGRTSYISENAFFEGRHLKSKWSHWLTAVLTYSLILSFKHFLVDVIWYFSFISHFLKGSNFSSAHPKCHLHRHCQNHHQSSN